MFVLHERQKIELTRKQSEIVRIVNEAEALADVGRLKISNWLRAPGS
jgi:hypothetical protein